MDIFIYSLEFLLKKYWPNQAPTIISYGSYLFVDENTPTDDVIYTVVANDPDDDSFIYSLSGTDALEINSNGQLTFIDTPDYESNTSYYFTINVSDGDLVATQFVSLFVNDLLETTVVNGTLTNDALVGGSENDILYGGYGKDVLTGGLGDDILDGGAGKDTIVFGDSNTRLYLSDAYDGQAQDTGHGNDTIMTSTIENVTSGAGNDLIVANTQIISSSVVMVMTVYMVQMVMIHSTVAWVMTVCMEVMVEIL